VGALAIDPQGMLLAHQLKKQASSGLKLATRGSGSSGYVTFDGDDIVHGSRGAHASRSPSTSASSAAVAAAWKLLSATPSPYKEPYQLGGVASRDESAVVAINYARHNEELVVELLRSIGEVVVYGEQHSHEHGGGQYCKKKNNSPTSSLQSPTKLFVGGLLSKLTSRGNVATEDERLVLEYFCDKNMLALLVDIAQSVPDMSNGLMGVTWTPHVKSQVLQTVSILVSNVQDPTSLYYLLSNNHVNSLIQSMVPLRKWTLEGLEEMVCAFE
jgi:protein CLEC16A